MKLNKGKLIVYPLMLTLITATGIDKLILDNNDNKLNIISSYNDNNGYHPKVINFSNKWNGYKYWMAYTPYTDCNDKYENPHIMVSNDKYNWKEPKGFNNPLEPMPKNHKSFKVYNSDTHLLYNNSNNTLECWWRYVKDTNDLVIIKRKITNDGINWSKSENMYIGKRSSQDILSPAVFYENGQYNLYGVGRGFKIINITSKDGHTWSKEKLYDIKYDDSSLKTWHIDIINNNGIKEMIMCAFKDSKKTMNLYYSKLENDKFSKAIKILEPSHKINNWDNLGIYRSSLIYENNKYYIFYSANSDKHTQGIGLKVKEKLK